MNTGFTIHPDGAAALIAAHGSIFAMEPSRFAALTHVVARGAAADAPKWSTRTLSTRGGRGSGAIAVIPIAGFIAKRRGAFVGTALDDLSESITSAVKQDVAAIILNVDSPGGEVAGVEEAAALIRNARNQVPIIAVVNTLAASAAYWLAAQASEIIASPSSETGSIGVWTAHVDQSRALDQAGLVVTLVSAGKYKVEGNPYEPLGDEARAEKQRGVDSYHRDFIRDVARGRRTSSQVVASGYGQGRLLRPREAQAAGMIDGVASFDEVVALAGSVRRVKRGASSEWNSHLDRATAKIERDVALAQLNRECRRAGVAPVGRVSR